MTDQNYMKTTCLPYAALAILPWKNATRFDYWVNQTNFEKYGFNPLETPALEGIQCSQASTQEGWNTKKPTNSATEWEELGTPMTDLRFASGGG